MLDKTAFAACVDPNQTSPEEQCGQVLNCLPFQ